MGTLKEQRGGWVSVAGVNPFHNGDGVCYLDEQGHLQGFRINRVEGNKLFPAGNVPHIRPHTTLFRNLDQEFERTLAHKSAERKIRIRLRLGENAFGFSLTANDEDGNRVTLAFDYTKERARTPQIENLRTQLAKLGGTPYELTEPADIVLKEEWFVPSSVVTDWRRQVVKRLTAARHTNYRRELVVWKPTHHAYPAATLTYLGNVMNDEARRFYLDHGVKSVASAYEKQPVDGAVLMFCRHCLRYSMGWCPVHQKGRSPYREPYYLARSDRRRFRLEFDCKNCQMKIYGNEE